MNRKSAARVLGAVVLAAGAAVSFGMPATAAPDQQIAPELLQAMQRDLGLTSDQVYTRMAQETQAAGAEQTLRPQLGDTFGGAWFDAAKGKLVVGVTDPARFDQIRAAGADATLVGLSQSKLDAAKDTLDKSVAPASVNGWFVDVQSNALVVELSGAPTAADQAFIAKAGVPARTVQTEKARALYNVRGGDAWYGPGFRCSVGFSATTSSGAKRQVTAGHCTEGGGSATGYNQVAMGTINGSVFGTAGDFGKVDVTSSSWTLTGKVNHYGGTDVSVKGSTVAAIGASVCRSGSTTGWHCGTMGAYNQTVSYTGGPTVTGLTRTNVCAEPGDSGGSFITTAGQAQGMTSGGSGNCTSGGTTYFQPVNEALSYWSLRLVLS